MSPAPNNDASPSTLLLLGKIDGKLDQVVARMDAFEARQETRDRRLDDRLEDVSNRVSAIERWRAWIIGVSVAGGATAGASADRLFTHFIP